MQTTPSMNWGREPSPRPCTPRNERNLPRRRSLLHVGPISQNDQRQRIERKLLAQTVRTEGQSLSQFRCVARFLNSASRRRLLGRTGRDVAPALARKLNKEALERLER